MNYYCPHCAAKLPLTADRWRCNCGGLLQLSYTKQPLTLQRTATPRNNSLWQYIDSLPFVAGDWEQISLGEGGTPLIAINANLYAKADYYMPTLSFKDRGAVTLVALAKKLGVKRMVADSSGNAGTAIAAYAARANIACDVFVPAATSAKKIQQIEAHGATIHKIAGSREATAAAAIELVERQGLFYASHIYNPVFWEGTKTYVYEIFEQCNGVLPPVFIIPAGNGTLLLGAYLAFTELLSWGLITTLPRILAVQAQNCAPLAAAFAADAATVTAVENRGTLAEGIAIANPARGAEMLAAIRATNGQVITVNEEEIAQARAKLAAQGIYVEYTAAANYAAYVNAVSNEPQLANQTIVMPLCGAGIKSN